MNVKVRCGYNAIDNVNLVDIYMMDDDPDGDGMCAADGVGTLEAVQDSYTKLLFHEIMHEADPQGSPLRWGYEHRIIDTCLNTCKKTLGISIRPGDDLGSQYVAKKCSYDGSGTVGIDYAAVRRAMALGYYEWQ